MYHKLQASDYINLDFLALIPTKRDIRQANVLLETCLLETLLENVGSITRPPLVASSWPFSDAWWPWDWRDWVISHCHKILSHFAFNQWYLYKLQQGHVAWVWIWDFSGVAWVWIWLTFQCLFYNAMFLMLFNQLYFYYVDFSGSGSGAASYTGLCFVILLSSRASYYHLIAFKPFFFFTTFCCLKNNFCVSAI